MQYSKLPIRAMSALLATLCSLSMAVAAPAALTSERTLPIVSTHADAHITGHVVDAMTKSTSLVLPSSSSNTMSRSRPTLRDTTPSAIRSLAS